MQIMKKKNQKERKRVLPTGFNITDESSPTQSVRDLTKSVHQASTMFLFI